jgi:hypothetical protein
LYNIKYEEKYEGYKEATHNVNENAYDIVASSNVAQTKLSSLNQSRLFRESSLIGMESSSVPMVDEGKNIPDSEKDKKIDDVVKKSKNFPVCLRDLEPLMPHCCEPFLNDFHFSWSFDHNHLEIQLICLLKLVEKELEKEKRKEKIDRLEKIKSKLNDANNLKEKKFPTFEEDEERVYFIFFFFFYCEVIYLKVIGKLLKARDVHPKKQIALTAHQNKRHEFEFGKNEGFYDVNDIEPLLSPEDFKVWMFFFYYFIILC